MKKKVLSFVIALMVALMPCTSVFAAQYQPTETIYAENYMLVSLDDKNYPVVCSKNEKEKVYPASLTKIVTAIVTLNNVDNLDATTVMSKTAYDSLLGTGAQTANLKVGEQLTIRQLLYLCMVHSACDACNILAEYVAGSIDGFVQMMNDWVKQIGCENTNFTNATGLHDDNHYTTVSDLRLITLAALQNSTFKEISETLSYKYNGTTYSNTNLMLNKAFVSYYYEYAKGIKTGSTTEAGYCLITTASKDGYNYLAIVCNSPRIDYNKDGYIEKCSFIDCATLFKWAFSSLRYKTVIKKDDVVCDIPIKNGKNADTLQLVASQDVSTIVPSSLDSSMVIIRPTEDTIKEAKAPVKKGDVLGKAEIIYADEVVATVDIVAAETVEVSRLLAIFNAIKQFFSYTITKVVLICVIAGFICFLVFEFLKRKKQKSIQKQRKMNERNK